MALSYHSEWMRDHWCDRDVDPEVCKIMQQVAAYDYARIAVNKTEGGVPGGVSLVASSIMSYTGLSLPPFTGTVQSSCRSGSLQTQAAGVLMTMQGLL